MAGTSTDFDAAEFRADVRAAMLMGLPKDEALRPIFHFPFDPAYAPAQADVAGEPWDYNDGDPEPTEPAAGTPAKRDPVLAGTKKGQVLCAVAPVGGTPGEATQIGDFTAKEYDITLLDVDHALVDGFHMVQLGGNDYFYDHEEPPSGLYDVTVHIVRVATRDEA